MALGPLVLAPRAIEIGRPKDTFFGDIIIFDGGGFFEAMPSFAPDPFEPGAAARGALASAEPVAFPEPIERERVDREFITTAAPMPAPTTAPTTGGAVPPSGGGPTVSAQPSLENLFGLFPIAQPTRQALPFGTAGTFAATAARRNPLATLLLLAGIAAVGYFIYQRYIRKERGG